MSTMYSSSTGKHLNVYEVEQTLARELQKRKLEEEAKQSEIKRIFEESEQLKILKQKISTGYISKERAAQIQEKQMRTIQELVKNLLFSQKNIFLIFILKLIIVRDSKRI